MKWYLKAIRQYGDCEGRAQRSEFWTFYLIAVASLIGCAVIVQIGVATDNPALAITGLLFAAGSSLFHMIPIFSVSVRRLHDTGRSAWWLLWWFVPYLGIILLVIMCFDSKPSKNAYGDNPKAGNRGPMALPMFEV